MRCGPDILSRFILAAAHRAKVFGRARQAFAIIEFALVLPILVTMMLGSVDAARLIIAAQKTTQVASTIAEMLSQNNPGQTPSPSPGPQGQTKIYPVTYLDLDFAISSTMVIFPQVLQDAASKGISWQSDISISIAGICFGSSSGSCSTSCTAATCTYANVAWNSGPNKRPCGTAQLSAPDTAAPSPTALPTDIFATSPVSVIAVDVVYNYTPVFGLGIFGTIPLRRTSYLAPRNAPAGSWLSYNVITGDDSIGAACTGF